MSVNSVRKYKILLMLDNTIRMIYEFSIELCVVIIHRNYSPVTITSYNKLKNSLKTATINWSIILFCKLHLQIEFNFDFSKFSKLNQSQLCLFLYIFHTLITMTYNV